ncbi:hypothetical protein ACG04R_10730 [Roseateles sp. BYS78W]|uniref:Uncharacterized protein n=1 Tax=Pelomonas candidula TaxID=3299025 RepID=A0ABW7HB56_9BURK
MSPLLILLAATAASAPLSPPATRAEVAAQRAAVEQQFVREKAECEQRFAVSACLDELRQRRRDALAPLVRHEHELAAEERRDRAAAQAQRVKERELAADQGQHHERLVTAQPAVPPKTPASHAVRARSEEEVAREQARAANQAAAEAAQRRERAQAREEAMRQRIAEHEARQKNRTKPLAKPLPLPSASAASTPAN